MSTITFSEIMKFYPEHNRSVYEDLKKYCQQGYIIPFVGAGLSVFCGYKLWPDVLKELNKFIYNRSIKKQINLLIKQNKLLQAAQDIHDNYPRMFQELQKIVDYGKIKNCDKYKLYTSAAYILPYLFNSGIVLTTNFDRVLEEIYEECKVKFGKIITPYEQDILSQIRQTNPHCLFKLHGDIGPETHDAKKLIFTKEQYDEAYDNNGPLMQELPNWFLNKRLLFLGCSLAMDKTMEVLQKVIVANSELNHYAILPCKTSNISKHCIEMGKMGISPIYYPAGQHEAVQVILSHLLEEIDNNAYEKLIQQITQSNPIISQNNRFMYDANYIDFIGRKHELQQLNDFCDSAEPISWWAVTGPGGSGKSRLVYEFTNKQHNNGWEFYWLQTNDYNKLSNWQPPVDRCIVVADDVQAHLQDIAKRLTNIFAHPRSEKLRIIMLEREGKDFDSAKWTEIMQDNDSPYDDTVNNICYDTNFLQIEPLSENELKTIMINFAQKSGKSLTDEKILQNLLQTLQRIDNSFQRPIYALAIVDAWCNGKNPNKWDKTQLLDELLKHELQFYFNRLYSLFPHNVTKTMRSELEKLLANLCLIPFLPLEAVDEEDYPKLSQKAQEIDLDFKELLCSIGIVKKINLSFVIETPDSILVEKKSALVDALILDFPDLLKEHLVLQQAFNKKQLNILLPNNWENKPTNLLFINRLSLDYPERLANQTLFWNKFFSVMPQNENTACMYSNTLFAISMIMPEFTKLVLNQLNNLCKYFPNSQDIAFDYAKTLFNLTEEQNLVECTKTVQELKFLHNEFFDNQNIALEYAKGLFNLTVGQNLNECKDTVQELKSLHKNFSNSQDIALAYANALSNLTVGQNLAECKDTAQELRSLHKKFSDSQNIALEYANTLINVSFVQNTEQEVQETLQESNKILKMYPDNVEIQLAYAETKFNLTLQQISESLQCTITELRDFLLQHKEANKDFQTDLEKYLTEHPEHIDRYSVLKIHTE